ncbi:MAG: hypothetical protein AAFP19_03105 [Bacteroidota bacterium]
MKKLAVLFYLLCMNMVFIQAQVGPGGNEEPNQCINGPTKVFILSQATYTADNFCNAPSTSEAHYWQISGPAQVVGGSIYTDQITIAFTPGASVGDQVEICLSYFCEGYCGSCCITVTVAGFDGCPGCPGEPSCDIRCDNIAEPCDEPIHEFCITPPTDRNDWNADATLTINSYNPSAIPNAGCQNTTPPSPPMVITANSQNPILQLSTIGTNGIQTIFSMIENCAGNYGLLDGESIRYDFEICLTHKDFPSFRFCCEDNNIFYRNETCDDSPCRDGNFPPNTMPWLYNAEYDCANGPGDGMEGNIVEVQHDLRQGNSTFELAPSANWGERLNIRLTDMNGRILHQEELSGAPMQVQFKHPNLAKGIYFITLTSDQKGILYTDKILID